jgi:predicted MFS family arabinose efflux permease
MRTSEPGSESNGGTAWPATVLLAIASAALIVTVSMGVRQSFGLLMQPVGRDLAISREAFGFAIAIQNLLFGLVQPFVGALADRYGARRLLIVGALVYAGGLAIAASAHAPAGILFGLGACVGLALSGTTFVVVLGAVGRLVAPQQRSVAFGLVTAGGSFGQFAVVPMAQSLISGAGWRTALLMLAALLATIVVAAFGIRRAPAHEATATAPEPLATVFARAAVHPHYLLLNLGFFVCGFHIAFVGTHLPAFLVDGGLGVEVGAQALALVGLFNIAGSYLFGWWGGRHSKPLLLGALYLARAVAIAIYISVPLSAASTLVFAAVFGFLWLGTVPLTSGVVASMFGMRHLSALYGAVFLSHQIGSFLGAWSAGWLFDRTHNYDAMWYASIILGVVAAAVSLATRDAPVVSTLPAANPA